MEQYWVQQCWLNFQVATMSNFIGVKLKWAHGVKLRGRGLFPAVFDDYCTQVGSIVICQPPGASQHIAVDFNCWSLKKSILLLFQVNIAPFNIIANPGSSHVLRNVVVRLPAEQLQNNNYQKKNKCLKRRRTSWCALTW